MRRSLAALKLQQLPHLLSSCGGAWSPGQAAPPAAAVVQPCIAHASAAWPQIWCSSSSTSSSQQPRSFSATAAAAAADQAQPESNGAGAGEEEEASEKVTQLAADIMALSVLECSQLSRVLRDKLGVPRGSGLPMMPVMAAAAGGGAPAAAAAAAEPAEVKAEKTEFDVKLEAFSPEGKIKVIKEIRALTNLGLKEAKELVSAGWCGGWRGGQAMSAVHAGGTIGSSSSSSSSDGLRGVHTLASHSNPASATPARTRTHSS
jgi:large subunit ribosomal protein L7/L12